MSREPKVVIVGTSSLPTNDTLNPSAIFDDSDEENADALNEDTPTENKPPGPVAAFFIRNRAWVITIGVLLLTIIALSLTVYFINIKCNNTICHMKHYCFHLF